MRRGEPLADLQKRFNAGCVLDTTDWDGPGNGFEVWTRAGHRYVEGVCDWCGTPEAVVSEGLQPQHQSQPGTDR